MSSLIRVLGVAVAGVVVSVGTGIYKKYLSDESEPNKQGDKIRPYVGLIVIC